MGTCNSIACARVRRRPLAACLSAALAFALVAPAPAATPAENLLHRPADGLSRLFDKVSHRAAAVQAARDDTRRPEGGIFVPVTSCADDGGTGTLRHVVLIASTGDTVDMRNLTCGTITLVTGAIGVDIDNLTILGPGASRLTIDANHASRVFHHGGAGTLQLTDVTVANGNYSPTTTPYGGGCV